MALFLTRRILLEINYLKAVFERFAAQEPDVRRLLIAYRSALRECNLLLEVLSQHPAAVQAYWQRQSDRAVSTALIFQQGLIRGISPATYKEITDEIERGMELRVQSLQHPPGGET